MEIPGHVQNGVVVLRGGISLPEGAEVTVSCKIAPETPPKGKRFRFPLVHSDHPGSLALTNERIAEILDEEDIAHYAKFFLKNDESR